MEWLASGRLAETDAESLQDKLKEFH